MILVATISVDIISGIYCTAIRKQISLATDDKFMNLGPQSTHLFRQ